MIVAALVTLNSTPNLAFYSWSLSIRVQNPSDSCVQRQSIGRDLEERTMKKKPSFTLHRNAERPWNEESPFRKSCLDDDQHLQHFASTIRENLCTNPNLPMSDTPQAHHSDPSSNELAAVVAVPSPPPLPSPPEAFPSAVTKRQRHLGEIGEQPASVIAHESYIRRCKQVNVPVPAHYPTAAKLPSSSKTRPLTQIVRGGGERENLEPVRAAKVRRVKSNRGSRGGEGEEREFGASVSPVKERGSRDADAPFDVKGRNWGNGRWCMGQNDGGVRAWLGELGLERYAPVFEIHEVDEEVLHLLTLEDLKDMGINAVGSRRKMYHAIQKLRKVFR